MGIYAHRFYFKQGAPKFNKIEEKFHKITGLKVQFYSIIHMKELMTEEEDILYYLNKRKSESNATGVNTPYFSCEGFNNVYIDYMASGDKTCYLEFGIGKVNKYFYKAMIKTMLEIGGRTYSNHISWEHEETDEFIEQFIEPYRPYDSYWKRIKPWNTMSQFEKDRFNSK